VAEAATATRLTGPNQTDRRTAETPAAAETAAQTAVEAVVARAAAGGYAMVGPSARTWSVDPATGIPVGPLSQAEHRLVRDLIAQERLDGTEPVWLPCADGGDEIVALLVPARTDVDDPLVAADPRADDLPADTVTDAVADTVADAAADTASARGGCPAADGGAACEDADGWFCGGYDAAHDAYLAGVGHTDIPGPLEPHAPAAPRDPAKREDPADLAARLTALGNRVTDAGTDAGAPAGGWWTVSAARAAGELVGRGYDPDTARALVVAYLRDTSERAGAPAGEWGLDQADIDAITTQAIDPEARDPEAHDTEARATAARTATRGLPAAAVRVVAEQGAADADRAVQLGRWHVEDERTAKAGDTTADIDDGLDEATAELTGEGCGDEAGWSR
jgi:hypothetical protein